MALQPLPVRAILQCAALGAVAALTVLLSTRATSVSPELGGSIILYLVALIFAPLPAGCAVAVFLLSGAFLLPESAIFEIFRSAVFALAILASRESFAPGAVVTLCWILALGLNLFSPESFPVVTSVASAVTAALEILWSVAAWFILCLPPISHRFALPHVNLRQFFVHMLLLPFFAFLCMAAGFIMLPGGMGFMELLESLHLGDPGVLFGALCLILGGILLSALLAHLILDVVEQYETASLFPGNRRARLPFADAVEKLDQIHAQANNYMKLRRLADELLSGSSIELEDIPNAWIALRKASQVLAGVPDAVIAVTSQQRIAIATPSAHSLLGFKKGSLVGQDIGVLRQAASAWAREIHGLTNWAAVHVEQLQTENIHRAWTEADQGVRLEISIRVWMPKSTAQSEKMFAFYLRIVPDTRAVQEALLVPTSFERIGASSAELFVSLSESIRTTGEQLSLLSQKFHNSADSTGRPLASTPAGPELSQLLIETDKVLRRLSIAFEEQSRRVLSYEEQCEELPIDHYLSRLFGYLHQALGLEKRVPISVMGEPIPPGPPGESKVSPCFVPAGESAGLGQYLMWFVRCLLPRARDLRVEIDQEQLGSGTASLIAGAIPGRYVRVTLVSAGQSIPPHVLSAQHDAASLAHAPSGEPLAGALFLLTRQVRRLGGFITLQSSPGKGTRVGIYLPNDGRMAQKLSLKDIRRLTGHNLRRLPTQVLIVGEEGSNDLSGVKELLERCSLVPVYRSPRDLFGELSTPVDFDGRGFDEGPARTKLHPTASLDAEAEAVRKQAFDSGPVRLLIFDCDQANFEAISLLDELEKEIPQITKIVLLEPKEISQLRALPHWVVVPKPVNGKELEEKIRNALKSTAGIHESLLMLEGNDPVSGSGL